MDGVTKEFDPEVKALPPVEAANQSITFPADDADIETVPVPQRDPFVPAGTAGTEFTVAVTTVRVTETQPVAAVLVSA